MSTHTHFRIRGRLIACAVTALIVPWSLVRADRPIQDHKAADPQGEVEIVNVSGEVEVTGWDKSEVEVGGTAGDSVDRVDVTSAGNRTTIRVVPRTSHSWSSDSEAHLIVHLPSKSSIMATLVSADFTVKGVSGDLKVQTVSGNISGDTGGDVHASAVSGEVRLTAHGAKSIELKTISGDVHLMGGGGDVDVTTVSGSAVIELGDVSRGRFKSISGDMSIALGLLPDGQIDSEAVSGDIHFTFAAVPAADFDVQSFSGDIKNCFGPKAMESHYGPGSRLQFTNGDGHGRVRINTKSGDVSLCNKGASRRVSAVSLAQVRSVRLVLPYVY